jgi:hypothetical protein
MQKENMCINLADKTEENAQHSRSVRMGRWKKNIETILGEIAVR